MNFDISLRELKLRYQAPWKAILYFCIPPILIMLIQGLYNIIDKTLALQFAASDLSYDPWYLRTYKDITGDYSVASIPIDRMKEYINIATQYASQTYNLLWAFSIMVGLGCALNFSIAFGRRDREKMAQITGNGFTLAIILSMIVSFAIFFVVYPGFHSVFITSQMGSRYNPITEQLAWEYSYPMLLAAPLMFLSYYFVSLIRSEGRMYWSIASIFTSIFINAGAAILFMSVFHWKITGAMMGTVFSWFAQVVWGFFIVFGLKESYSRFRFKDLIHIKKENIYNFSKVGFSNFLANFALVITSYVSTSIVVQLPGQSSTSDISIYQQLASSITPWMTLILSVGVGITQGSRAILAYCFGAKRYNRIWQILKRSSVLLMIWFTFGLMVFIFFGKEMMLLFAFPNSQADKYRWWLVINFMTYPFCAVTYICLMLFQGINRSALATFSNSLRTIVVILPLNGLGFLVAHFTGNAIYYFVFVGINDLISATILIPFLYKFWKRYKNSLIDNISEIDLKYDPKIHHERLQQ